MTQPNENILTNDEIQAAITAEFADDSMSPDDFNVARVIEKAVLKKMRMSAISTGARRTPTHVVMACWNHGGSLPLYWFETPEAAEEFADKCRVFNLTRPSMPGGAMTDDIIDKCAAADHEWLKTHPAGSSGGTADSFLVTTVRFAGESERDSETQLESCPVCELGLLKPLMLHFCTECGLEVGTAEDARQNVVLQKKFEAQTACDSHPTTSLRQLLSRLVKIWDANIAGRETPLPEVIFVETEIRKFADKPSGCTTPQPGTPRAGESND